MRNLVKAVLFLVSGMLAMFGVYATVMSIGSTYNKSQPITKPPKITKMQHIFRATLLLIMDNRNSGSAVVISPTTAISASHVCEIGNMVARDFSGQRLKIYRVMWMPKDKADVCIIKGDFSHLPNIELGDSRQLHLNEPVYTTGYPGGMYRAGRATVIALELEAMINEKNKLIYFYADVLNFDCRPGTSGGAVITQDMRYIGTIVMHDERRNECLATPLAVVAEFVRRTGNLK